MDETLIQASKLSSDTPVLLPPHRRRHFKSETYRTLLRIFSHCYDESFASPTLESNLNTGNDNNELWRRTEEQRSQHVESVSGGGNSVEKESSVLEKALEVSLNGNDKGSEDIGLSEQMSIDQIEQLMGLEENEDLSNQKDVNLQCRPAQMLIDELEHLVQGNENISQDNSSMPLLDPLHQNQSRVSDSSGNVSQMLLLSDNTMTGGSSTPVENYKGRDTLLDIDASRKQENMEVKSVSEIGDSIIPTFGDFEMAENHSLLVSEGINVSVEKNTVVDSLNSSNKVDDQRSSESNAFSVGHEMQLKDIESEKTDCVSDKVESGNHTTEVMEEGEISGGYSTDEISMDSLLQDAEMQDKKVNEELINRCITDRNEFFCNDVNDSKLENSLLGVEPSDKTNNSAGPWESDGNKTVNVPDAVLQEKTSAIANDPMLSSVNIKTEENGRDNSILLPGNIFEEDYKSSADQENVEDHPNKRKRGPLSKEKRAKKKVKERKKRAEKNRQLGVRRLKLHSISKPKPIQYCRHYLHGRCQEGDNCKFSHDTIPLTKAKPCCHFARHSCMKGDDCPFDHQLSKYPCSNFASNGFCNRGDDCFFSHKIQSGEDPPTASKAMGSEKKLTSLVGDLMSKKQQNYDGVSSHTSGVSFFSTKMHSMNSNETVSKQPGTVAKGTSFVTVGNSPSVEKLKYQCLSQDGNADAKARNHVDQLGFGTVQIPNDVLSRTPPVATPKGINFLSFGRSQQDFFSGSKLASTLSSGDNGMKLSPLDNSKTSNQSFSDSSSKGILPAVAPKGINFLSFGNALSKMPNQTITTASSDSIPKEVQTIVPKGVNFLSLGKTSKDDFIDKGKAKLTTDQKIGTDSFVKVQQSAVDELQKSSSTSSALPSFPISLFQSSGLSASKIHTNSRHSAQKALFSTLAFAARYESRVNLDQSAHAPEVRKEIDNELKAEGTVGGSQNSMSKPSKVLEFLSSIGCKNKQESR